MISRQYGGRLEHMSNSLRSSVESIDEITACKHINTSSKNTRVYVVDETAHISSYKNTFNTRNQLEK